MDLSLSDEQRLLRDSVERFVRDAYGFEQRKAVVAEAGGFSRRHWATFAELGWLALPFAEADGGLGGGGPEVAILMEAFGRGLVVEPYLPTVLLCGGLVAALAEGGRRSALLEPLLEGRLQLALAYAERQARYDLFDIATTAQRQEGGGYVLDGRKSVVLNAPSADWLIVAARTAGGRRDRDGISLFLVDRAAPGLDLRDYPTLDGQRAAEVTLTGVSVPTDALLGPEGGALSAIEAATDRAIAALCAEAVGCIDHLVTATVEYTRTRVQFGQPIARFQVLKHRMADMAVCLEQARSMAAYAARHWDTADATVRGRAMSAAKAKVGQAARFVAQQAVQLHGAMGVTEELNVGHYMKRLMAIEVAFGSTDHHLRRFGSLEEAA
ncbi:acyl-CoA dehydrogenase family protein [Rhodospirillum centenum]|uniref:Acyl-CoA dehydrogenase, putative n=1 Tax=Rhodospirillum centenum (strain ATCC 51521 / SW) TaxID=414684 RepID=B6IR85_RHOCS|nr:acyl-CoA dehydrogenase [Rhodospirillum centenum]ACI97971.1 acyl-CoA dehydrogenase, putative [Rhodospirillum centenum SW]